MTRAKREKKASGNLALKVLLHKCVNMHIKV